MTYELELTGLNGGNLLAYLSALGVLRTLSSALPENPVKMSWRERHSWTPVLHTGGLRTPDDFLAVLQIKVCGAETADPAWAIADDLNLTLTEFRNLLEASAAQASCGQRATLDFLAAFGSDVIAARGGKEVMADTEFRTMSGAGHQHFLASMRELAAGVTADHLRRALFSPWDYQDERPSLRWDPADYRPHALRAADPSKDPIRTMRGANRLAVEALPWFPTAPAARSLRTVGFRVHNREVEFTWPIWKAPLPADAVRSLLAMAVLQAPELDFRELEARGIARVFRARRFTDGKYRNFSPARELM